MDLTTRAEAPGRIQAGQINRVTQLKSWLSAAGCLAAAMLAALLAFDLGFSEGSTYLFFMSATVAVGYLSRSYPPTLVAAVIGALIQNWRFVRPYFDFSIDHQASLATFVLFTVASVALGCLVVRRGREADARDAAQRRTEALFDLTGSYFYAHGTAETVNTALRSIERLFGRSCAIYLSDPFVFEGRSDRDIVVRVVEGDLDEKAFTTLIEKYVVHWVFENRAKAGGLTDVHDQSDIIYLPLVSQTGMEGVLAMSVKNRKVSASDLEFLDIVADQVKLALERQSLNSKHRRELRTMHATNVRSRFVSSLVGANSIVTQTVHVLGDSLLTVRPEYARQREAIGRFLSEETARAQIMLDRVQAALNADTSSLCDVAAEVGEAVDILRTGLAGKVLQYDPGKQVPGIAADAALVRLAAALVLECACGCVRAGGVVEVNVRSTDSEVLVVVQDDRPAMFRPKDQPAFQVATSSSGDDLELVYERTRSSMLRRTLLDRDLVENNEQAPLETLLEAMGLPSEAGRTETSRDSGLNRQRVMRLDRMGYGLYVAALVMNAHGGSVRQRERLGGGVVVTMSLPRG